MRLFAAIAVPDDIAQGLVRRQQGLPGARWRPPEALHIVRYHSAYVIHTSGEYGHFLSDKDRAWMPVLHAFRDHIDLYTKRETPGRLEDHLPGIYEIVHRHIRPDYKLRW